MVLIMSLLAPGEPHHLSWRGFSWGYIPCWSGQWSLLPGGLPREVPVNPLAPTLRHLVLRYHSLGTYYQAPTPTHHLVLPLDTPVVWYLLNVLGRDVIFRY